MKIKTKLIISFCIIIFVPSILAIATISAYCNFQSHVIEQTYGIKNADAYSIINSVPLLNRYTALDFEKSKDNQIIPFENGRCFVSHRDQ